MLFEELPLIYELFFLNAALEKCLLTSYYLVSKNIFRAKCCSYRWVLSPDKIWSTCSESACREVKKTFGTNIAKIIGTYICVTFVKF